MALYHVIYASTATGRLSQRAMLELLQISRRNNEERGLTGMLLYRNGTYLQFLEGPYEEVVRLLARLREDHRHRAFRILREGTLPERLFSEWSMAYKNLTGMRGAGAPGGVPGYSERLQARYATPEESEESEEKDPAQRLIDMFREMV
jgi:hypothetical protein